MEKPDGNSEAQSRPVLKAALFIGKFALAGGIIYWLVRKDFGKFVDCVRNVSAPWLALGALFLFLQIASCAWRWHILLKSQGVKIAFSESFSLYLQGVFFSLAIPGGAVGGDLVKAGMIAARAQAGKKLEGAVSVAADRITGMVGLFMLVLAIAAFLPGYMDKLDPAMKAAFAFLLAGSAAGLAAAAAFPFHELLFKIGAIKRMADKADAFSKGAVSRLIETARVYKAKWRTLIGAIAISLFAANPCQIACLYSLVIGVSGSAPDLKATSIAMLFGGAAGAIPLTPGGIGTRDAICMASLAAGGVGPEASKAAPLLLTAIFIGIALLGGALFAFDSLLKRGKVPKPAIEEGAGAK